jgi:TonB family protein
MRRVWREPGVACIDLVTFAQPSLIIRNITFQNFIMMPAVLRSTLSAALLAALPVLADPVPAAAPAPTLSPALQAVQAAIGDLRRDIDPKLPLEQQLERMAASRPSPQTADKLRAVFGTDRLYALERRPSAAGKQAWRATLLPLHTASPQGSTIDWSEGLLDLTLERGGKAVSGHGGIERVAFEDANTSTTWRGITFDTRQQRGYVDLWFGSIDAQIAGVHFQNRRDSTGQDINALRFTSRVTEKPKAVDIAYDSRIGSIAVAGERVDDIRFALRMTNIDKKAMVELKTLQERQALSRETLATLPPQQQLDILRPLLRSFAESALARGTAIEIDEIGASYHGIRAAIKGRVALQGATRADLDDAARLAKKMVARFEVRLPMALVNEIAGSVAAKQVAAQAAQRGGSADPQAVAQLRQNMTDLMVGKLVGPGFARLENDVLVSTLAWKNGVLTANGKPVPLPAPTPPGKATPVLVAPGAANILQARLVDGSCTLPGFPDDVTRADRALRQRIEFTIGVDGRVKDAQVTQPSGFPDYDRAMLGALGQCTYIPALRDGKPIELRSARETVRSAGGGKP